MACWRTKTIEDHFHNFSTDMPTTLSKADVLKAVEDLPQENFALEDLIEHLIVIHKVRVGLEEAGQGIPHAEVVKQFKKPRNQRQW
jgi:hypothetical protein